MRIVGDRPRSNERKEPLKVQRNHQDLSGC
jgi:hypothetical protein